MVIYSQLSLAKKNVKMAIYSRSGYVLKYMNYISIKLCSYLLC